MLSMRKTKSVKIENKNLRFVITTNVSQILSNSTITKILEEVSIYYFYTITITPSYFI